MENEPKKRGPGRPRTNVQHYRYAASFPLDCWDYLLDASFRDSTPKARVSVQQYLNRLIYADMKKHHWTPEATTSDDQIEGQITTEEIEPETADKPKKEPLQPKFKVAESEPKKHNVRAVKTVPAEELEPWVQMNEYQEKQAKKDSKK